MNEPPYQPTYQQPPYQQTYPPQPPYQQTYQQPFQETYQQPYQQTYPPQAPYQQQPFQETYQPPYQQTYPPQVPLQQTYQPQPFQQDEDVDSHYVSGTPSYNIGRFNEDNYWRDIVFLILFALHFAGIVAIMAVGLKTDIPANENSYHGILPYWFSQGGDIDQWISIIETLAILVGVSVLFSFLYIQLMKLFPLQLIYLGIAFSFLSFVAIAVYYGIHGNWLGAIILGIFGLLVLFYLIMIRSRIPFAVEMIKSVVGIIKTYPGTQVTAYFSLFIEILWVSFWFFVLVLSQRFTEGFSIFALIYLLFSFYWVLEVIKNVVHVTVSGVIATVYFRGNTVSSPTLGSLKRAMTTSFGSICLGSLIVSFIRTLRAVVNMVRSDSNSCLLCLADCILGCLDSLVQYFNHYAYCQVAIYGKSFVSAAKATWQLFKRSGIEAVANDNLINGVLWMGILFNALVTGAVSVGLSFAFFSGSNSALGMFFLGFVIGLTIMLIPMQVIDSGIACSFVCFAEDSTVLNTTNPHLYQVLTQTYNLGW